MAKSTPLDDLFDDPIIPTNTANNRKPANTPVQSPFVEAILDTLNQKLAIVLKIHLENDHPDLEFKADKALDLFSNALNSIIEDHFPESAPAIQRKIEKARNIIRTAILHELQTQTGADKEASINEAYNELIANLDPRIQKILLKSIKTQTDQIKNHRGQIKHNLRRAIAMNNRPRVILDSLDPEKLKELEPKLQAQKWEMLMYLLQNQPVSAEMVKQEFKNKLSSSGSISLDRLNNHLKKHTNVRVGSRPITPATLKRQEDLGIFTACQNEYYLEIPNSD